MTLVTTYDPNNNFSLYSKLREYKENVLTFPSMDIFNVMYKCELFFQKNEIHLISNKLKITDFIEIFLRNCPTDFVPPCHDIINKLVKHFVIARIHFSLKSKYNNTVKVTVHSSRSVAMKESINKKRKIY